MIKQIVVAVALVAACKQSKPAATSDNGSGSSVPAGSGSAAPSGSGSAAVADTAAGSGSGSGAAAPAIDVPRPGPGSIAGHDPVTAESVHLELAFAMLAWHANPRDPAIYAKDFGGRGEPDARIELVPYDAWVKQLPAQPVLIQNIAIKTWLDTPGLAANESKVNVSYYVDHKDEYRELVFRREGGKQLLVSEKVNSRSNRDEPFIARNWLPTDATALGKTLTARFRREGNFAWVVVMNDKGAQAVAELWPDGPCLPVEPPKGALAMLRCTNSKDGHDFTLVHDKDELKIRRAPNGKDAPSGTDRTFTLAKGAKVTLAPDDEPQTRGP